MIHNVIRVRTMIAGLLIFILCGGFLFAGGTSEPAADSTAQVRAFVSILPQKYFVERIGGERVQVEVMVPPGRNPATYEPSPRQMVALSSADLFFTIGVAFERTFLPLVQQSLPNVSVVATDEGIPKRTIEEHHHEGTDTHAAAEPDPHIWMDPVLVKKLAERIRDTLIRVDPAGETVYRSGYRSFAADLDQLDSELAATLSPVKGSIFFVYHPAFGYFADRYGLDQVAIETGGKEPSPAELERIIGQAKEKGVRVIFVQPEFPRKSARAVADSIDGAVVPIAPLAENYLENLRTLARDIAAGISP